VIEDAKSDPNWVQLQSPDVIRSNINAPILIDGVIAGFLNVNSLVPNFYTSKDADILQIFANQAAIAIKHAQLHQQAVATAAMEERQRIARDLHDAVSQTLFSANLIAESLPRLWERRPDQAREQTQAVHRLTQAAAAEMRVLLFELRPESLVNTNLRELLTQLAHSIPGRRDLEISLIIRGWNDQLLPPDVQIAFYRIAQESLNNVLKHGRSRQVRIRMHRNDKVLRLDIMDNGRGFDTTNISGGIGLKSMWERAGSVGAILDIKSRVGLGTRVRLTWSEAET
jgi:two-component system nitrate/nitrite sensor histidine kinase NarX